MPVMSSGPGDRRRGDNAMPAGPGQRRGGDNGRSPVMPSAPGQRRGDKMEWHRCRADSVGPAITVCRSCPRPRAATAAAPMAAATTAGGRRPALISAAAVTAGRSGRIRATRPPGRARLAAGAPRTPRSGTAASGTSSPTWTTGRRWPQRNRCRRRSPRPSGGLTGRTGVNRQPRRRPARAAAPRRDPATGLPVRSRPQDPDTELAPAAAGDFAAAPVPVSGARAVKGLLELSDPGGPHTGPSDLPDLSRGMPQAAAPPPPAVLDDDPLTSPSFPKVPASDSRSYRNSRATPCSPAVPPRRTSPTPRRRSNSRATVRPRPSSPPRAGTPS